jgi:hypothetical protein
MTSASQRSCDAAKCSPGLAPSYLRTVCGPQTCLSRHNNGFETDDGQVRRCTGPTYVEYHLTTASLPRICIVNPVCRQASIRSIEPRIWYLRGTKLSTR